jgi:hypothetical protein
MSNIRGHKVIIEREYTYYFTLLFWFVLGATVGASGMRLYYMMDNYLNAEPITYICKQGIVYEQADPISTVYLKTNQQCIEEKM